MRPPRRPRTLSREEARLWGEIAKLIRPLRSRAAAEAPEQGAGAGTAGCKPTGANGVAKRPAAPAMPPALSAPNAVVPPRPAAKPKRAVKLAALAQHAAPPPAPPAPAPVPVAPGAPGLERRERQRLSRGLLPIEARIDLHGLYQAEAHAALVGFLMRARAAGHARVLVVTGKGGVDAYAERGVLRRSVPHWLRGAELRTIVLGFEESARHHGGAGALYVRLRRR